MQIEGMACGLSKPDHKLVVEVTWLEHANVTIKPHKT